MRAICDTNILISYLLSRQQETPIRVIVEAALQGIFTLLVSEELIREFAGTVARKKYLADRITRAEAEQFVEILLEVGEVIPTIQETIPAVTRDAKDDYLLAYALIGQADYLVSGDDDLLSLGDVGHVKIISPREFATLLRELEG